jgi:NADH-quinone oxidoreductase subunit M
MTGWYILSLVTFLPLVGVLFIWVIRINDDASARRNIRAWSRC